MEELDLDEMRATYDRPSGKSVIRLLERLEQAEQDRVKLRNRLDAMRRQRDGYRNQLRRAEQLKYQNTDELRRHPMPDTQLNPDAIKAARLVYGGLTECEAASDCDECQVEAGEIIRAYLAVARPELQANSKPNQNFEVVNSVEELKALPIGSVILDGGGDAGIIEPGAILFTETNPLSPEYVAKHYLPARVLYRPEVES